MQGYAGNVDNFEKATYLTFNSSKHPKASQTITISSILKLIINAVKVKFVINISCRLI